MDTHKTHNLEISQQAAEMPAAAPKMRNSAGEEQTQQQLGSLARIVSKTLGLTFEEALQMTKDLDFKNARNCRVSGK